MAEWTTVVENVSITYSGLVDVGELFKLIDEWFRHKGYDKVVVRHIEQMTETGKKIEMLIQPYKKTTDYIKNRIHVWLSFNNIKDVEIKRDKQTLKLNKGDIYICVDGFLETDYEHRWEQKPMFFFLRTVIDKYLHRAEVDKYEEGLAQEVSDFMDEVRGFLNLYKIAPGVRARKPSEAPGRFPSGAGGH